MTISTRRRLVFYSLLLWIIACWWCLIRALDFALDTWARTWP